MDSSNDSGIVGLNVGGKIYKTSRATLTRYPDSFFSGLLEGSVPSAKDDQGNYFIDRDRGIFVHVLNYLRNGELLLPDTFSNFRLLEREADFFLLDELKVALNKHETIGLVDVFGKTYRMSRESLLREPHSFFAKMVGDAETPVLKDSQGNFAIANTGSTSLPFKQILQFLKVGGIFSDLTDESSIKYLEEKAKQFGLKILPNQIQCIRYHVYGQSGKVNIYIWLNGPCVLYGSRMIDMFKDICHVIKHLKVSTRNIFAGLVDVQRIPHDASQVDTEHVTSYFLQRLNKSYHEKTDVTSYCTRIDFY